MKTWTCFVTGFVASTVWLSGTGWAQHKPVGPDKPAECEKAGIRERVEGQVAKVDPEKGKLTVLGSNGDSYEFEASKETLQSYKVGDKIEARLRVHPNCKSSATG
jgi:hypothetical protein